MLSKEPNLCGFHSETHAVEILETVVSQREHVQVGQAVEAFDPVNLVVEQRQVRQLGQRI